MIYRKERITKGITLIRGLLGSKGSRLDTDLLRRWIERLMSLMEDFINGEPEKEEEDLVALQERINET